MLDVASLSCSCFGQFVPAEEGKGGTFQLPKCVLLAVGTLPVRACSIDSLALDQCAVASKCVIIMYNGAISAIYNEPMGEFCISLYLLILSQMFTETSLLHS